MSAQSYAILNTYPWYINPRACRRVWLKGVVLVSVLGLCLFLCSLAARSCFVWIKVTPPTTTTTTTPTSTPTPTPTPSPTPTPLLLYSFLPSSPRTTTGSAGSSWHCLQHYRRLQLLVTGRTRYWSTSTHLICVPFGGSSTRLLLKLLLIYGSVFVSSSLRLPRSVHVNLPWGNLSPLSPSMQRTCWVCCQDRGSHIVPGATLLGRC